MTVLEPAKTEVAVVDEVDLFDTRIVRSADGPLRTFNEAGALSAADVHVALRLGRLGSESDERVLLAAAFAVRGPRLGHVCVDLASVRESVIVEGDVPVDLQGLPWPAVDEWVAAVAGSGLVAVGADRDLHRPLRFVGSRLYLDRYWREEQQVARDLLARAGAEVVDEWLGRLFVSDGDVDDELQRDASRVAATRHLAVVAGGPGTGKTTTVARILALLHAHADAVGAPPPLVALAAPTGKAAARLEEAVHDEARRMDVSDEVRARLLAVSASTLHRLLGWKPRNRARFRHDRTNRLPHEVVIVDETSMVSLSLMARLLEAVRPTARLVLVGDPEQLASVEAGAVLGDVVGPAAPGAPLSPSIVVLRRVHRFGGAIASLATAVQDGDASRVLDVLRAGHEDVTWVETDVASALAAELAVVRWTVVSAGSALTAAALAGDGRAALDALASFRLLCAHRRGPHGVSTWTAQIEEWLADAVEGFEPGTGWYPGRPLLFSENDYGLQLFNGDTGVVVARPEAGGVTAVFERRGQLVELSPHRLGGVDTVHAMTVHKAQGSQFGSVALLLPDPSSPILTRELLYTAVTRAQRRLIVAGTEDAIRAAVERPIARASGLRDLLWESNEESS